MDQADLEPPQPPVPAPEVAAEPPEFLNPESPHYQPWADKQIVNASKDKRPLADFMVEFSARVDQVEQPGAVAWDPGRNERALARYAPLGNPPPPRRHRRRSSGKRPGRPAAPVPEAQGPSSRESGRSARPAGPRAPGGGERRGRRRRSRGGRRPPEQPPTG